MKLPKTVMAALVAGTMGAGCASGAQVAQKPTVQTRAPVVASSGSNQNDRAETETAETETDWTADDMMAACGRG